MLLMTGDDEGPRVRLAPERLFEVQGVWITNTVLSSVVASTLIVGVFLSARGLAGADYWRPSIRFSTRS